MRILYITDQRIKDFKSENKYRKRNFFEKKMALHAHNSLSQLEVQKNDVSPESTEILILKQALKEAEERARILQLELKSKFNKNYIIK